jgi:hypothetical protein
MKLTLLKYLLLTFLTFIISCQKDRSTFSEIIIGKWEWLESVSPWTGLVTNPQTAGYSITLEFTSDGIMNEYKDGTMSNSTNYSIEINLNEPNKNMLTYDSGISSQVYIVNDSLIINAAYVDGPVSSYIRKTKCK